jgi:hypothetical protein
MSEFVMPAPNMPQHVVEEGKKPAKVTESHIYFFGYDTGMTP